MIASFDREDDDQRDLEAAHERGRTHLAARSSGEAFGSQQSEAVAGSEFAHREEEAIEYREAGDMPSELRVRARHREADNPLEDEADDELALGLNAVHCEGAEATKALSAGFNRLGQSKQRLTRLREIERIDDQVPDEDGCQFRRRSGDSVDDDG